MTIGIQTETSIGSFSVLPNTAEKSLKKKINILAISTSEIKISVLIRKKFTMSAIKSLHSAYGLARK